MPYQPARMHSLAWELFSRVALLRTTLETHLRLRLEQRRAELIHFAADVLLWDTVLSSAGLVQCSDELPPFTAERASPGTEVPRTVQVLRLWHWEFCSVNVSVNSPFVSASSEELYWVGPSI